MHISLGLWRLVVRVPTEGAEAQMEDEPGPNWYGHCGTALCLVCLGTWWQNQLSIRETSLSITLAAGPGNWRREKANGSRSLEGPGGFPLPRWEQQASGDTLAAQGKKHCCFFIVHFVKRFWAHFVKSYIACNKKIPNQHPLNSSSPLFFFIINKTLARIVTLGRQGWSRQSEEESGGYLVWQPWHRQHFTVTPPLTPGLGQSFFPSSHQNLQAKRSCVCVHVRACMFQ